MGDPLYRAPPAGALRILPLDALTLIYHRASGITHIVDAPVPEILDALAERPLGAGALLAILADRFDLGDADPLSLAVRLDELVAAGLVERFVRHIASLRIGPIGFRVGCDWRAPIAELERLYADYPKPDDGIPDFNVHLFAARPWRRLVRPSVRIEAIS